jgi:mono/diheme cytochrome c family protein
MPRPAHATHRTTSWFAPLAIRAAVLFAVLVIALPAAAWADEADVRLPAPLERPVDFAADVRPLFARHCHACHGPDVQESGLRLDQKATALAGGKSGPAFTAGLSADSRLIRYVAGTGDDEIVMPPEGERLSRDEIALLRAWIDQGANWPDDVADPRAAKAAAHWAFKRPVRPAPPRVKNVAWVRNEIDAFVLQKLESRSIEPSPEADRATLIRRVSLDLVGLPPSPEEVACFVADPAPDAYERLVDRLLASPHFGERWARHWLDLARYADSSGYEMDRPHSLWRYRDWVIDALNRDLPFDRFVIEQLAGDLIEGATASQVIASGFHAGTMYDPGVRWEAVLDQVNTTGTVFLGLTVGCAQCHSHKFDPISQREYYALYAFFDSATILPFELATPEQKAARDAQQARVEVLKKQRDDYEASLKSSLVEWAASLPPDERSKLPPPAQAALATTAGEPSANQVSSLLAARTADDPRFQEMCREIDERTKEVPVLPASLALQSEPRETRLFVRGNHERPGEVVTPGVPAFLPPLSAGAKPTRLDLARWLTAPENSLTARVAVNRIWQRYFGRALVEPANNFGVQTPPPLHQQLLDWLACEFVERGWSTKAMHRLIVCSATYRQSSRTPAALQAVDPTNELLARQRRLRVEAEIVRDLALVAGGLLSTRLGGESVFPYQPEGVLDGRATKATWTMSAGGDRYRRGLYTWTWRLTPHPMLALFDAPDASMACTRRDRSNTPIQALTMLNDPTFVECAQHLAARVVDRDGQDDRQRLTLAYQVCFSRDPRPDEADLLLGLLADETTELRTDADAARKIAGELPPGADVARRAAWTVVCRTLLSLDEFVTRE